MANIEDINIDNKAFILATFASQLNYDSANEEDRC